MTKLNLAMPTEPAAYFHPGELVSTPPVRDVRLRVTSQPVLSPDAFTLSDSWGGHKSSTTRSALASILAHTLFVGAIVAFSLLPHKAQSEARPFEKITLIAPSIESYSLPLAIKQAGGNE